VAEGNQHLKERETAKYDMNFNLFFLLVSLITEFIGVVDLQTYPNPLQDNPAYSVVKYDFFSSFRASISLFPFQLDSYPSRHGCSKADLSPTTCFSQAVFRQPRRHRHAKGEAFFSLANNELGLRSGLVRC